MLQGCECDTMRGLPERMKSSLPVAIRVYRPKTSRETPVYLSWCEDCGRDFALPTFPLRCRGRSLHRIAQGKELTETQTVADPRGHILLGSRQTDADDVGELSTVRSWTSGGRAGRSAGYESCQLRDFTYAAESPAER